jgi:molecular chaperone HscB
MVQAERDYFEFFGLERTLNLDAQDLEKRYYQLSRKWHPDLFARKSDAEKQEALDNTALLNDAYRTLKDPIRRAEYVVGASDEKVPPELLEEVFELNMALEEGDESQLADFLQKFLHMRADIDRQLQQAFTTNSHPEIRALLNRRKYVRNLIKQVEAHSAAN